MFLASKIKNPRAFRFIPSSDLPPQLQPSKSRATDSDAGRTLARSISIGRMGYLFELCDGCFRRRRKEGVGVEEDPADGTDGWKFFVGPGDLEIATDYFSDENLLGRGGFGPVYKGRMPDGQEVAVKKLSLTSRQGLREFKNEVILLRRIQHRNLVTLLGCCIEGREKALVYEYLPNKSLDNFLFDKSKSATLDWSKRFEIIVGVAKGLLYLHEESPIKIIHRDIKASNILLDNQLNPKISDFGMARLFPEDNTHIATFRISGTHGYMAPEYALHGYLSVKTDVFSFGVVVLEIVSGRKNHDRRLHNESADLLSYTWKLSQEGKALELVDPTLSQWDEDQAALCIQIGLLCCQSNVADRPDMYTVQLMLSSDSFELPRPGKPGIQGRGGRWSSTASGTASGTNISSSIDPSTTNTGATKLSTLSSLGEDYSRNSISVSFVDEGR